MDETALWLETAVVESLSCHLYANATWLCERLHAARGHDDEAAAHLLATCYYRAGKIYKALLVLKGTTSPNCRYLYGLCCLQTGKLAEAESALTPPPGSHGQVPRGAAGHYLLGLICKQSSRREAAIQQFTTALSLDRSLWCAYEQLCILGADVDPKLVFADPVGEELAPDIMQTAHVMMLASPHTAPHKNAPTARLNSRLQSQAEPSQPSPSLAEFSTPSPSANNVTNLAAPPRVERANHNNHAHTPPSTTPGNRRKFVDEGKLRKVSGRLFGDASVPRRSSRLNAAASNSAHVDAVDFTTPPAASAAPHHVSARQSSLSQASQRLQGAVAPDVMHANDLHAVREDVLDGAQPSHAQTASLALLRTLGDGFKHMCRYKCSAALNVFLQLPTCQYQTGWVLSQVGRAYFEMVDYTQAALVFEQLRRLAPHHLEGLEVYSSVLWHLNRDVELSFLAQEVVALDRQSPQAWCVMGNCFSLHKEHDTAISFFGRALQLDPNFTYAHTLAGHEHCANEDFEKGLACYRAALRIDARHYNAWYGLGTIFYRQEKFELAEYHFRRALDINPQSSVLHCYLGMALHALQRNEEALAMLEKAIGADGRNPLARYERAGVLASEERYADALEDLQALKDTVPREPNVHFLMGKIYKRMGDVEMAMVHYSIALDLKPSSTDVNLIKSAIDKLTVSEDSEDEEL
eukprot:jgi/Chlat1/1569/Chrsp123S01830